MISRLIRIISFTLAPAVAGWFLVYIMNHPWANHDHPLFYWPHIVNWSIFLVASTITITGFVLDIREYCQSRSIRSQIRTSTRRLDTKRPQTGRRITDK